LSTGHNVINEISRVVCCQNQSVKKGRTIGMKHFRNLTTGSALHDQFLCHYLTSFTRQLTNRLGDRFETIILYSADDNQRKHMHAHVE
jgi:hypothetical protein